MITVHFCVVSFDPARGGMEGSARRLVRALSAAPGFRCIAYLFGVGAPAVERPSDVEFVALGHRVHDRLEASGLGPDAGMWRARGQQVALREAILRHVAERPGERHVLVSFYVSTVGFVAQLVAGELGLPHVACCRGSDLGHDLFCADQLPVIRHVARHASCLVTTSREHARYLTDILGRAGMVDTIYNSLPPGVHPAWHARVRSRVRFVSAVGYSPKKGTHLLCEAILRLVEEGLPVELVLFGRTARNGGAAVRRRYAIRGGPRISLAGWKSEQEVRECLLEGDVYCSATLSEGCPNATMLALALGLPTVASATGAPLDFVGTCGHVALVPPGDTDEFTSALRRAAVRTLRREWRIDREPLEQMIDVLSEAGEIAGWRRVLECAARSSPGIPCPP